MKVQLLPWIRAKLVEIGIVIPTHEKDVEAFEQSLSDIPPLPEELESFNNKLTKPVIRSIPTTITRAARKGKKLSDQQLKNLKIDRMKAEEE